MSDETTLLPCPICGKKVSIARTENEVGERWWFISRGTYKTTRCNCRLFLESEKFTCGWNDDYSLECRAKLIDKWNTRATLGALRTTSDQEETVRSFLRKICPNRDWYYLGEHEHALIADLISDIAATLGAEYHGYEQAAIEAWESIKAWNTRATHGTLTAEQVREAIEANSWAETSTIREFSDSSWQAIADELNVMLWSGTCENTNTDGYGFRFGCSECGYSAIVHNCAVRLDELPNFCPNCGARVRNE